jgi:formylmethanofuran dehydrogenase subunit B
MNPAGMRSPARVVEHVTCLGCGCACDDIRITLSDAAGAAVADDSAIATRIADAANACPVGVDWFGDGSVPLRVGVNDAEASIDEALDAVARLLREARAPLVYLAPELSCESQRIGVELADRLHAGLDSVTSSTTLAGILAAQERGSATVSLGEVRNRADVVLFWGVDPAARYPRYETRYAPSPIGIFVPAGRDSRMVIAADVGDARGPADADLRLTVAVADEVAVLTAIGAAVAGFGASGRAVEAGSPWALANSIAPVLRGAHYVAVVTDAEPTGGDSRPGRLSLGRSSALIALAQALNGTVRCGVSTLRAGGNRTGADAVLTGRTGFPCAIDFVSGVPAYEPYTGTAAARLLRGEVDAALLLGSAALVPAAIRAQLAGVPLAVVGPRASASGLAPRIHVDTGIPGIHEAGTALRMDDVPLPLTAVLDGAPQQVVVLRALADRLQTSATATRPRRGHRAAAGQGRS